jgi:hypothetical protein
MSPVDQPMTRREKLELATKQYRFLLSKTQSADQSTIDSMWQWTQENGFEDWPEE